MALLSLHTSFNLAQLALSGKKFLSFLVDLTLDLDFNLTKLLLFTAQLLLLETNRLVGEILWVDGRVLSTAG